VNKSPLTARQTHRRDERVFWSLSLLEDLLLPPLLERLLLPLDRLWLLLEDLRSSSPRRIIASCCARFVDVEW
jgi:hypothetical protein